MLGKADCELVAAQPCCWGRNALGSIGGIAIGSGRPAHPPCTAGNAQVKLDPKNPGLAVVDGARASPSHQDEGKVLWGWQAGDARTSEAREAHRERSRAVLSRNVSVVLSQGSGSQGTGSVVAEGRITQPCFPGPGKRAGSAQSPPPITSLTLSSLSSPLFSFSLFPVLICSLLSILVEIVAPYRQKGKGEILHLPIPARLCLDFFIIAPHCDCGCRCQPLPVPLPVLGSSV